MVITVNGKNISLEKEITVIQLLEEQSVKMKDYVTVQINEEIISREKFDSVLIKEGDIIEFIYFMGGGECGVI